MKLTAAITLLLTISMVGFADTAPTAIAVSSTVNPAPFGKPLTLRAAVVPSGASLGLITFFDGPAVIGYTILVQGQASINTSLLSAGTHSIRASYGGDGTFGPSVSPVFLQAVTPLPVTTFPTLTTYNSAGILPLSATIADFNSDGKADIVVANYFSGTVSVFLGAGNGTFQPATVSLAGSNPYAIAAGDFNQDGVTDIAVTDFSGTSSSISILLGKGDGTFQQPISYTSGKGPRAIVAGDLNGDGKTDLLVGNSSSGDVSVFIGNGDGTFGVSGSGVNYPVAVGSTPSGVAIGDINGDGKPDLLVSDDSDGGVWVLPANGNGTFQNAIFHAVGGSGPRAIAVADLNGDGLPDLAVANFLDSTISVLLASGGGNFQAPLIFHLNNQPSAIAVSDFNGDGKPDLVVTDGPNVSILLGNGNGVFQAATDTLAGGLLNSIVIGDFNGDGSTDIATTNNNTLNIQLGKQAALTSTVLTAVPNQPNYGQNVTLTATLASTGGVPSAAGRVTFFDGTAVLGIQAPINGVAVLNTSVLSFGPHSIVAAYGGDANFGSSSSSPLPLTVGGPTPTLALTSSVNPTIFGKIATLTATVTPAIAFGNVVFYDGTTILGSRPLVAGQAVLNTTLLPAGARNIKAYYAFSSAVNPAPAATGTLVQTVNPLPATAFPPAMNLGAGIRPSAVLAGDFTGDGKLSLAVANNGGANVGVLVGNGDGTFKTAVNYPVGNNPIAIASGDFNQDGKVDLAVANNGNSNVNILRGNGDGTFVVASALSVSNFPSSIAVGDFNGDGKADIAVSLQGDNSVIVFLGNGDGSFQVTGPFSSGGVNPSSLALGDFNGDGKTDIAVSNLCNASCSSVSVLMGNGDGSFQPPLVQAVGTSKPAALTVGDLNADGKADIAFADQTASAVVVLLGNGNGTFKAPVGYGSAAGTPAAVTIGDFNGDGKADLAVANQGSNNVSLFMGNNDGTFQAAVNYNTGTQPTAIAVGDLNQDGKTDFVVANQGSNNLSVFFGVTGLQLKFSSQPVNATAGVALAPIVVQVLDAGLNLDTTSNIAVTLTSVPANVNVTVNAVNGVATFNNVTFTAGATYNLLASAVGYGSALSNQFTVGAAPSVNIDTPTPLQIVTTGSTMITGWAIESTTSVGTAISLVQVKVDGTLVGVATYGVLRGDVCAAYPSRPGCPNVGFSFLLDTSSLTTGLHTITVSALDSAPVPAVGVRSVTIAVSQLALTGTRVGVYRQGPGFLEDINGNGIGPNPIDPGDRTVGFTPPGGVLAGDLPVVGDWTGDGKAKPGFFRPSTGTWWLDANGDGVFNAGDFTYQFGGLQGDVPVVGDWNAVPGVTVNKTCIGIYRSQGSVWLLDLNCNGQFEGTPTDAFFPFGGLAGDVPVVGSWTGGTTRVGVVRKYAPAGIPQGNPFFWVLDAGAANAGNQPANHPAAAGAYAFGGLAGDVFVTGDWNNSGVSRAGVYRAGLWVLDLNGTHTPDLIFSYGGVATDVPLTAKW